MLNIAICEDIKSELDYITEMIRQYNEKNDIFVNIDTFESGEEFVKSDLYKYNLVITDIYMGEIGGFEAMKILRQFNNDCQIVFCTSTRDFAVESYEVNALGYLVKPVDKEKLFEVLKKFYSIKSDAFTIRVKDGREEIEILCSEFMYAESRGKKTEIYTTNGVIVATELLKDIFNKFDDGKLIRPIRYAIVNKDYVKTIKNNNIIMKDGYEISISRSELKNIKEKFIKYSKSKL